MRKVIAVAATSLMALSGGGAQASEPIEVEHYAPLPCTVLCPHWDVAELAGYSPCPDPFPAGSYDQTTFRFTTEDPDALVSIVAKPEVDYDTYVCTATEPSLEVANGANLLGTPCDDPFGLKGCEEHIQVTQGLVASRTSWVSTDFIVRSYNWSDIGSQSIRVEGPVEIVDDSFIASIS